eukprot:scaffold1149_cov380-Prasinococcus_capsulatus_cf.AAC.8
MPRPNALLKWSSLRHSQSAPQGACGGHLRQLHQIHGRRQSSHLARKVLLQATTHVGSRARATGIDSESTWKVASGMLICLKRAPSGLVEASESRTVTSSIDAAEDSTTESLPFFATLTLPDCSGTATDHCTACRVSTCARAQLLPSRPFSSCTSQS